MTVPLAVSSGYSGFGPQLSLSYESSAGNGLSGFGRNLPLASIARNKGLPSYDGTTESDVFLLSRAHHLVPLLLGRGGRRQRRQLSRTLPGGPA
jgi:hypothetical protein